MDFNIRVLVCASIMGAALGASLSLGAERASPDTPATKIALVPEPTESPRYLKDERQASSGSVLIGGHAIGYQAEAGILVVHVKDPLDDDPPPPRDEKSSGPS